MNTIDLSSRIEPVTSLYSNDLFTQTRMFSSTCWRGRGKTFSSTSAQRLVRDPWFADESGAAPRLRHGDRRSGSMTPHREMSFNPDLLIFTVPFPVRAAPEAAPALNCAHSVSLFDRHFLYRSHAAPRPRPNSEHYVDTNQPV